MKAFKPSCFVFLSPKEDIKIAEDILAYPVLKEKVHYVTHVVEHRNMVIITVGGIETSLSYYDWKLM